MAELVDSFRKSLDEGDICMMADVAVTMEEDFLLDIISDLDPTASVYCKSTANKPERKSSRQIAQRRRSNSEEADGDQFHPGLSQRHRGDVEMCPSPESSLSGSDVSSSFSSGAETGAGAWETVPVVTPEQMFALGRMVKEQRSSSSMTSSVSSSFGAPESLGG